MLRHTNGRVDPWPLPLIPSAKSVAEVARSRLLHDDGSVQLVSFACQGDCEELRVERTHSHHVLTLLHRGACTIRQTGRSVTVDATSILVHRPGTAYHTEHPYGFIDAGWSLAYDDATAEEVLATCGVAGRELPLSRLVHVRRMTALAGPLTTLFRQERTASVDPLLVQGAALELFARVHDPDAFAWSPSDPHRRSEARLVERACESLRARLAERVRLADVARDVGCSEFRLYRAFRRQRGTSPGDYLHRLRLSAVMAALAGGSRSLTDLALELGFASHSHMTATFQRHVGRTPRRVRSEILD